MTSIADQLTEALASPAAEGNAHAVPAVCRLAVADDPESEAKAIIDETVKKTLAIAAAIQPIYESYMEWIEDGIADAEDAANEEPG